MEITWTGRLRRSAMVADSPVRVRPVDEEEAVLLFRASIAVDGLGPVFWYQDDTDAYVDRVVVSGITAFNHTMSIPYDFAPDDLVVTMAKLRQWDELISRRSESLLRVERTVDITRAKA